MKPYPSPDPSYATTNTYVQTTRSHQKNPTNRIRNKRTIELLYETLSLTKSSTRNSNPCVQGPSSNNCIHQSIKKSYLLLLAVSRWAHGGHNLLMTPKLLTHTAIQFCSVPRTPSNWAGTITRYWKPLSLPDVCDRSCGDCGNSNNLNKADDWTAIASLISPRPCRKRQKWAISWALWGCDPMLSP